MTKCFLVTTTNTARIRLRRYVRSDHAGCAGDHGYHNAISEEVGRMSITEKPYSAPDPSAYKGDIRWPTHCTCGYLFQDSDEWQVFTDEVYEHGGKEYFLRDSVPGMMWDATWAHDYPHMCGPDGRSIHVVCPDGHSWCIDSRASNCDMPNDHEHKCWVRHGEPPNLTVDKNGRTCGAGAGSIATPGYHGFLRNGEFT